MKHRITLTKIGNMLMEKARAWRPDASIEVFFVNEPLQEPYFEVTFDGEPPIALAEPSTDNVTAIGAEL